MKTDKDIMDSRQPLWGDACHQPPRAHWVECLHPPWGVGQEGCRQSPGEQLVVQMVEVAQEAFLSTAG